MEHTSSSSVIGLTANGSPQSAGSSLPALFHSLVYVCRRMLPDRLNRHLRRAQVQRQQPTAKIGRQCLIVGTRLGRGARIGDCVTLAHVTIEDQTAFGA